MNYQIPVGAFIHSGLNSDTHLLMWTSVERVGANQKGLLGCKMTALK